MIYCCGCNKKVYARLTTGKEVYPNRVDLSDLPFWRCDNCGNFVGCHHKTQHRTTPLGVIATPQIKNARQHIHRILDPLWKSGRYSRVEIYKLISKHIGYEYHTAEIKNIEEAREIYRFIRDLGKKQNKSKNKGKKQ